jgi:DNA-binding beta-propeller fold protein YncE
VGGPAFVLSKVIATIPVEDGPFAVAMNPISGRVYVANRDDNSILANFSSDTVSVIGR